LLITPRSRGCLLAIIAAVMLTSGCAKDGLNEREVRAVCMNLGAGGWREVVAVAKQAGISDEARAAAAIRRAVQDTCPAYADRLEH
jgi:hypothetical protein